MEEMEKQIADFRSKVEVGSEDLTPEDKRELLEYIGMLEILKASAEIR